MNYSVIIKKSNIYLLKIKTALISKMKENIVYKLMKYPKN